MGHSKNHGRRGLTLPLPLRAKMIGLAMFIGGFMGLITSAQLDPISARVERVIDGDTIQVRFEGKSYTVRLIGVDTPETKHPTKAVQYFGREASAFTKAALEGKTVLLQKDRTGDTVDRGNCRRCCTNRHRPARGQSTGSSSPDDAIRHWSAEVGHPIEDLTTEDGLTPLPSWTPGEKTIADDGLVAEERVLHPALTMVP